MRGRKCTFSCSDKEAVKERLARTNRHNKCFLFSRNMAFYGRKWPRKFKKYVRSKRYRKRFTRRKARFSRRRTFKRRTNGIRRYKRRYLKRRYTIRRRGLFQKKYMSMRPSRLSPIANDLRSYYPIVRGGIKRHGGEIAMSIAKRALVNALVGL